MKKPLSYHMLSVCYGLQVVVNVRPTENGALTYICILRFQHLMKRQTKLYIYFL